MKIFVDTSGFIAITDHSDQFHRHASRFLAEVHPHTSFHTTNYIFDETLTCLRYAAGHKAAVQFAETLYKSEIHEMHYVDHRIEQEAFKLFKKLHDQKLSFTDCVSVFFMEELGIQKIFAFDDDFKRLGYETVP